MAEPFAMAKNLKSFSDTLAFRAFEDAEGVSAGRHGLMTQKEPGSSLGV